MKMVQKYKDGKHSQTSFGGLLLLLAAMFLPLGAAGLPDTLPRKLVEKTASGFLPLDQWTSAVLSGDKDRVKKFYMPGAQSLAQTPRGTTRDAAEEESAFWSAMPSRGLASLTPKILEQRRLNENATQLVLRIEMIFQNGGRSQQALVVSRQSWIRVGNNWMIQATNRSDPGALPVISLPQPKVPNTHLYADAAEGRLELIAAISSAKADHKHVLVVFGANWCYDCHVLDATLRSKDVAPLVAANYHVVHVNVEDGDSNSDLADRFQVPLKKGIPSLAVLDENGQLITSQKQGEFESAAKIGISDVLGFLNRWKPSR